MSRSTFPVLPRVFLAVLFTAFAFVCGPLPAEEAKTVAKNPFIKLLIGEWESEGELKGMDGNVITVKEQWTASVVSDTTFTIDGKRELNADTSNYTWTITFHPDTGVYEAMHSINNGQAQRFEGSFIEGSLSVEWTAQADGGSVIKLLETFSSENRETFDTEVTFTNGSGETTLSGKIVNKKVKKA